MTMLTSASADVTAGTQLAAALGADLLDALYEAVWPGSSGSPVAAPEAPAAALAATRLMPDDAEAWHFLSVVQGFDRSALAASVAAGRSAARLDPTDPRYVLDQAVSLSYAGKPDEAAALLAEAIRLDASYVNAWTSLGYIYIRRGLVRQAVDCQRAAVELDPASGSARQLLATALRVAGDADGTATEDLAREAVRLDPARPAGWLRLAMELALREDYAGARQAAGEALQQATSVRYPPLAHASLAVCHHVEGQVTQAQEQFAAGARSWAPAWQQGDSFAADLLWYRALCELGQGLPSQAMDTLGEAVRALPPGMTGDPIMRDLLEVLSHGPELAGLADFRRGSQAMTGPGPDSGPSPEEELAHARRLASLADLLARLGNPAAAVRWHESALQIRAGLLPPEDAGVVDSLNGLGVALYHVGEPGLAKPNLERALAVREGQLPPGHPGIAETACWLGLTLWWLSETGSAAEYLRRAARAAPGQDADDQRLAFYGQILWARHDFEQARAVLTEAVELSDRTLGHDHPQTCGHLRRLGSLLWAQQDLSGAAAYFARASAIDPAGLLAPDREAGTAGPGEVGSGSAVPGQSPVTAWWTDEEMAAELDAAIQAKTGGPAAFRRSTVVALGHPAGEVTNGHGSESDLVHFRISVDGQVQEFLPVFTRVPALVTGLAMGGPMWWSLSVLSIHGDALLDNVGPQVTVVINPWTWLEYQLPPGA
jgi:tetratricopeptide (TPR) repeat protein